MIAVRERLGYTVISLRSYLTWDERQTLGFLLTHHGGFKSDPSFTQREEKRGIKRRAEGRKRLFVCFDDARNDYEKTQTWTHKLDYLKFKKKHSFEVILA